MNRRKTAALNHVSDVAAQVRINDLRASNAEHDADLLVGHVTHFKNASLFGFDQEDGFVFDLGVDGGRDGHFKNAFSHGLGIDAELNFDGGLLRVEQDFGRIGLLQRHVLEVNALDIEYGVEIGIDHELLS